MEQLSKGQNICWQIDKLQKRLADLPDCKIRSNPENDTTYMLQICSENVVKFLDIYVALETNVLKDRIEKLKTELETL